MLLFIIAPLAGHVPRLVVQRAENDCGSDPEVQRSVWYTLADSFFCHPLLCGRCCAAGMDHGPQEVSRSRRLFRGSLTCRWYCRTRRRA
ncbi:MAG: hypothetical protein MZV63_32465 [Marinilabiliales bacterium]|nr:hypothetical protein [Marinilabiliales bacterium]